ncbi:putative Glycosyltransferase, group 1 [Candidatus Moduliflexus flocculans]|uniref:Putative Glycosyltransferase, group 1 n=1 Tax=Candidatus Moduliflexus flocculans TaxID=1499966 RepID=A0A0S6W5N1_9BACT|nr:putative Glycosyltransferase, group 1 [Candidatus Moduliflexus flocculans]
MIKVCHLITKLELGGAQQNTLYTVSHLDRQRFLPILMTGPEGRLIQEAEEAGHVRKYYIPELVREIRPGLDFNAFQRFRHILQQEYQQTSQLPMIVHTHSSKAGILGRWAAKSVGISPIIHSIHGFGFHRDQRPLIRQCYIALERLTARVTTHFIAVSAVNIQTGVDLRLFSPSRVSLIRSGIEIEKFQQYARLSHADFDAWRAQKLSALGWPQNRPRIGMVACFKPQKAPLEFVRVIERVAAQFPDVHAVMVGDGELRSQIEALIQEKQLQRQITLAGWQADMPEIFPLFDMLVLTSHWEGLPRVCPQAMAAGLPIVATHVDGIPEAVIDGVNGFLKAPGDIDGLADQIVVLLRHPDQAKVMGSAGQQRVAEFDIHRMVQQQEELYLRLTRAGNVKNQPE